MNPKEPKNVTNTADDPAAIEEKAIVPAATAAPVAVRNDEDETLIMLGGSQKLSYSSWKPSTDADMALLFKAANDPDYSIKDDGANREIHVRHVFFESCQFTNEETGEITDGVRTVLIDTEGKSWACASGAFFNAMVRLFTMKGKPDTWAAPVTIIPKTKKAKRGQILTFALKG